MDLGAGDDTLSVHDAGSATIRYSKGDGNDTLDGGYDSRNDTLLLTDIDPSDVSISRNGDAALITILDTNEVFTLSAQFRDSIYMAPAEVSTIRFSDGTIWDRDQIQAQADNIGARSAAIQAPMVAISSRSFNHWSETDATYARSVDALGTADFVSSESLSSVHSSAFQLVSAISSYDATSAYDGRSDGFNLRQDEAGFFVKPSLIPA